MATHKVLVFLDVTMARLVLDGTSFTVGFPTLPLTTSSPASTCCKSFESDAQVSETLTIFSASRLAFLRSNRPGPVSSPGSGGPNLESRRVYQLSMAPNFARGPCYGLPDMMVLAHRGASEDAPENTILAFERAVDGGCTGLETDVRRTADGRLVLIHDARVDRTTDGTGTVADLTWAEIERLDAGSWKHPQFSGTRIPLLSELFAGFAGRVHIALELKAVDAIDGVAQLVSDAGVSLTCLTFTSFEIEHLEKLSELLPTASCGYLVREWPVHLSGMLRDRGIRQICPPAHELTRELVDAWRSEGFSVRAWRVRSDDLVLRCLEAGVDGFTVDFPARATELIARHPGRPGC